MSHRKTRSHNAATNCYTFTYTLAGKLFRQLWATRVNFFAASRSALVILPGKNTKCRGGRIPRCGSAVRLDGSMTLMHVCAAGGISPCDRPSWGRSVEPSPYQGFRPAFRDFRPNARLLACSGSTICLSPVHVRCVAEISAPGRLPWEAASQLGTRDGVSVFNVHVEQALQSDLGRTNN